MLSLAWTLIDTALRARTINHIQREAGACDHHDAPNCAERTGALAGVHGRVRESPWLLLASSEARVLSRTDPCMCMCPCPSVRVTGCACVRLMCCRAQPHHGLPPTRYWPATRTPRASPPAQHQDAINDRNVRVCMCMHIVCMWAPGQHEPARGMLACSLAGNVWRADRIGQSARARSPFPPPEITSTCVTLMNSRRPPAPIRPLCHLEGASSRRCSK
jgi:hypothetical protein